MYRPEGAVSETHNNDQQLKTIYCILMMQNQKCVREGKTSLGYKGKRLQIVYKTGK
jgi:hypothetical protein